MTEKFEEWKAKLDQSAEKFKAGVEGPHTGWQAIALTLIADLDRRINTLMNLRYGLHYSIVKDDKELYEVALVALSEELGEGKDDG